MAQKSLAEVARSGANLAVLEYFRIGVEVFSQILLLNFLTPEIFGIWSALINLQTLIAIVTTGSLVVPTVRELAMMLSERERFQDSRERFSVILFWFLILTAAGTALFSAGAYGLFFRRGLISFAGLLIATGATLFRNLIEFGNALSQARFDYKYLFVLNFLGQTAEKAFLIISFATLNIEPSIEYLLLVALVFKMVAVGSVAVYSTHMGFGFTIPPRGLIISFFRNFGLWSVSVLVSYTLTYLDSIILPLVATPRQLGFYFLAKSVMSVLQFGFRRIRQFLVAYFASARDQEVSRYHAALLNRMSVYVSTLISSPVIAGSLGLLLLFSTVLEGFLKYIPAYQHVSLMLLIVIVQNAYLDILLYSTSLGKYKRNVIETSCAVVVFLATLAVLIHILSPEIATIMAYVLSHVVRMLFWFNVARKDNIPTDPLKIMVLLIPVSLVTEGCALFVQPQVFVEPSLPALAVRLLMIAGAFFLITAGLQRVISLISSDDVKQLKMFIQRKGRMGVLLVRLLFLS